MNNFMEYDFDVHNIELSCFVAPGCGTPIHKNRSSHGIVFHLDGIRNYIFDEGKSITVHENDILYIPKASNYIVETLEKGGCYAINFNLYNDTAFLPFKFKVRNFKSFISLFQNTNDVWIQKKAGFQLKSKSLLYSILFELKKEYELGYLSRSQNDLIKPAIDYIHEKYTIDNITVSYLSSICGISEAYFRRIFLKAFGISPIKYINNLKIDRAKELIDSGMYSLNEAAEESGFQDDSYFSRKFKDITGLSPSEYKSK